VKRGRSLSFLTIFTFAVPEFIGLDMTENRIFTLRLKCKLLFRKQHNHYTNTAINTRNHLYGVHCRALEFCSDLICNFGFVIVVYLSNVWLKSTIWYYSFFNSSKDFREKYCIYLVVYLSNVWLKSKFA
jgi:hypothetical protein